MMQEREKNAMNFLVKLNNLRTNYFSAGFYKYVWLVFFFFGCSSSQNKLVGIDLVSPKKETFSLSKIENSKATVFIFLKPDCPLSQNYTLTLNNLFNDFKNDSILFLGVIPCCVSDSEANDFILRYKILFPVLTDAKNETVNYFKASCTPEVFVIDRKENILYQGAIDNWAVSIGKHRTVVTDNYLEDALTQIRSSLTVTNTQTKAVGCIIEKTN